jgi:hypothetical protein
VGRSGGEMPIRYKNDLVVRPPREIAGSLGYRAISWPLGGLESSH